MTLKTFLFLDSFQYYTHVIGKAIIDWWKEILLRSKTCNRCIKYHLSKGYLLVASHPPFWVGGWVQHQNPRLTLHTLTHPVLDQRVLTGRMSALVAAKLFTHVRKRRIVEAVRAQRETLQNVQWKHYRELQDSWFRTLHVEVLKLGYKHNYNFLCSNSLFGIFVVLSAIQ